MREILKDTKILAIDDDPVLLDALKLYFESQNALMVKALSVQDAKQLIEKVTPDIVLLDKNFEGEDGFDYISELRSDPKFQSIPIVIMTGSDEYDDKLQALKIGADDIMIKPFSMDELSARIVARLRRSSTYRQLRDSFNIGDLKINLNNREVFVASQKVDLTETEFNILVQLVSNKDYVVNRDQLSVKNLSARNTCAKTLNVHISSLRKKLGEQIAPQIRTVRSRGFMFVSDEKSP